MRSRPVPTCVLGSSHDEPVVVGGHDPDRYAEMGSFSKVVTATVLQRLSEQEVVALDDPVERWLGVPAGTGITLRHLAGHTSGLPRVPPGLARFDPYRAFTEDRLRMLLAGLDRLVVGPPGEREEYSNLGYAVLGAALTAAAGRPYMELVAVHLLAPLGLPDDAMVVVPPEHSRSLPTGLFGRSAKPWTMSGAILPAGGLWASPRTMARVLTGLVVDRSLGEPALGWQRTGPLPLIWHNGGTGTASMFAGALPDGRWTVVHRLCTAYDETDGLGVDELRAARVRPE
ncbi:serine hydrolase domain-containing protein [Streptomyces sp. KAU_LT]|uniref:serine hydrolase domain-containing protein n=1 Tax=unclassified Streptomyces TaxID=2593676 RepID=UPI0024B6B178|nr:serine hydrolase domain-containing protein [Streptomyces sp. KAU_LT]MDI9832063.1 serine hydrolase domain-containing protein [Streptomyces sp. KAU_LT]